MGGTLQTPAERKGGAICHPDAPPSLLFPGAFGVRCLWGPGRSGHHDGCSPPGNPPRLSLPPWGSPGRPPPGPPLCRPAAPAVSPPSAVPAAARCHLRGVRRRSVTARISACPLPRSPPPPRAQPPTHNVGGWEGGGCSAFRPGHARGGHGDTADPTSRLPATPDDRLPAVPPAPPTPIPAPLTQCPSAPLPPAALPAPRRCPGLRDDTQPPPSTPTDRPDGARTGRSPPHSVAVPKRHRQSPPQRWDIPSPPLPYPPTHPPTRVLVPTDAQTPLAPHARGRDGGDARPGRDATRGGLQSGQPGERSATPEGRAPAAPRRTPRHPLSDPRHLPSDPLTDPRHSPPVPRRPPPDLRRPSLTYAVPGSPGSGGEEQPQGEERGHRPPGSRTRPGVPERRLPNCDRPNRRSRCASHRRLLRR